MENYHYDLNLVNTINSILLKPNGTYGQIRRLWSHKELCDSIKSVTEFLPVDSNLITRVWYILHDKTCNRTCDICGTELSNKNLSLNYPAARVCNNTNCKNLVRKHTLFEKYGEDYYETWKTRVIQTNQERYGTSNAMFNKEIRQKQQQCAHNKVQSCKNDILLKRVTTVKERYGVTNVGQLPDHKYKMQQTSLDKYGAVSYSSTEECKQKVRYTASNRTLEQKQATAQKRKETLLKKYGVAYYSLTSEFIKKHRSRYLYQGISFDSSYELFYYLWHIHNALDIQRCTDSFEYVCDGITFHYTPDFIVDNQYIEIKGSHFIDVDGNLFNPFSKDPAVQRRYREKGNLMKRLGVLLITDISKYRNDVIHFYGKEYINKFRVA